MLMQRSTYYVNKRIVNVFIEYKNNKNMYLKIKKGQIYCTVPFDTSYDRVNLFVTKHVKKFDNIIQKNNKIQQYSLICDFLYFKGKKYYFNRLSGFNDESIEIYHNKMYIKTNDSTDFSVKHSIINFLIKEAHKYFDINLIKWSKEMNLNPHSYSLIKRRNIWGYNLINKDIIKFNYSLIHFKTEIIDYVIVHELTHSIESNHSNSFWDIVAIYIPNYKEIKLILKDNGYLSEL